MTGPFQVSADGRFLHIDPPMPMYGTDGPKIVTIAADVATTDGRFIVVGLAEDGRFYEIPR
jgi:hypothetical protein